MNSQERGGPVCSCWIDYRTLSLFSVSQESVLEEPYHL